MTNYHTDKLVIDTQRDTHIHTATDDVNTRGPKLTSGKKKPHSGFRKMANRAALCRFVAMSDKHKAT